MTALSETFAALGNSTRLAIVERLLREGELSAGELVSGESLSPPAISHHFRILRQAGIVVQRVDRQRRLYSVRPQAVEAIGKWSLTYRAFWDGSLARLGAALGEDGPN